ncbi:MAG: hypothetical protein ABII94_00485 [Patescibacteria group bacterium]
MAKRVSDKIIYCGKFEHHFNKKWTDNEIKSLADEMLEWFRTPNEDGKQNIWLNDFFIKKTLTRKRAYEFIAKNEYFRNVHEVCQSIQESILFKLGLKGTSAMPIFALKNISKWKDNPVDEDFNEDEGLEFKGWD